MKNIETKFANNNSAAQAMYLRAMIHNSNGQNFDPLTNKDNQFELRRAKEICEEAIKKISAFGRCSQLSKSIIPDPSTFTSIGN
jgi:hypothetical protein